MPPLHNLEARGPHAPVGGSPARVPGSIRRTSSIDSTRHRPPGDAQGDPWGQMTMDARARDLLTNVDGTTTVIGTASVTVEVKGVFRELDALQSTPPRDELQQLRGAPVGPGFRSKVDALVPDERDAHSLLYLLLDDLPGAGLVSGYSMLQADAVPKAEPGTERHDEYLIARSDLCAGWASDGSMMTMIREHGKNPTPLGPEAPSLWADDVVPGSSSALGWHDLAPLAPTGMRRIRRIDVLPADGTATVHPVDVFFRDSYADPDGIETVVHEYSVSARIDAVTRTVEAIDATANVLPWQECPGAIASATRLVGHALSDLRPWVRETFVGTTTCTHLNDVLRGLSDVGVLLDAVAVDG